MSSITPRINEFYNYILFEKKMLCFKSSIWFHWILSKSFLGWENFMLFFFSMLCIISWHPSFFPCITVPNILAFPCRKSIQGPCFFRLSSSSLFPAMLVCESLGWKIITFGFQQLSKTLASSHEKYCTLYSSTISCGIFLVSCNYIWTWSAILSQFLSAYSQS